MSDNVLIAIIAASGVVISAILVFGAAVFAFVVNNKHLDKRLERIGSVLQLIQSDLREFFNQTARIKAHIKLD